METLNLQERCLKAARVALRNKGYKIVGSTDQGPVALDGEYLVFVNVSINTGRDFAEPTNDVRRVLERAAFNYLAKNPCADSFKLIRFDDIQFVVTSDDRALLRHESNFLAHREVA